MCFTCGKKLKGKLPLSHSPGQGRRKASTTTDDRNLLRLCKKDRTKSSKELSSEFFLSKGKQLSARTVHRRLLDMGYKAIQRSENQSGNLFSKKHDFLLLKNTNISQRNGIVSSGVMDPILKYSIEKNRTVVRRLARENDEPFDFMPRAQSGGDSVSVWSCTSGGARGPLVMYSGNLNGRN